MVSTDVVPVFATGDDDLSTSTETFPWYWIDSDGDRVPLRGISSLRRVDDTTLELIDAEAGTTFFFVFREGGSYSSGGVLDLFVDDGDGEFNAEEDTEVGFVYDFTTFGGEYFRIDSIEVPDDPNGFTCCGRIGGFGYETPSENLPESGIWRYSEEGAVMYVVDADAAETDPPFVQFDGSFQMIVDFEDGTFSGEAFDGSAWLNLDDDVSEFPDNDDQLFLVVGMSGDIVGNTLVGTVSGEEAFAELNEGETTLDDLTLTLSSGDLEGRFFREAGDVVSGTWGANFSLSLDGDEATGQVVGFFEGPGRPVEP